MVCGRHGTYWPESLGRLPKGYAECYPARRERALLKPSIDHLFDRGFIGFEGNGNVIVSPVAHRPSLERMGIEVRDTLNVGAFTAGQRPFLEFHRDMVLLKSAR